MLKVSKYCPWVYVKIYKLTIQKQYCWICFRKYIHCLLSLLLYNYFVVLQRIAIARALLKNSPILILDEVCPTKSSQFCC